MGEDQSLYGMHSIEILSRNKFELNFLAQSLVEFGDVLKQMADVKYALDDNVKQNYLEPLHQLQMKDLKEVMVRSSDARNSYLWHIFLIILLFTASS